MLLLLLLLLSHFWVNDYFICVCGLALRFGRKDDPPVCFAREIDLP
jgi:hypothetical protein